MRPSQQIDVHENVSAPPVSGLIDKSEASIFLVIFHDTSRHVFPLPIPENLGLSLLSTAPCRCLCRLTRLSIWAQKPKGGACVVKKSILAAAISAIVSTTQAQALCYTAHPDAAYVTPGSNGTAVLQTPGRTPTYLVPRGDGSYVIPGQRPTYVTPRGNGTYAIQSPGQAPVYLTPTTPRPCFTRVTCPDFRTTVSLRWRPVLHACAPCGAGCATGQGAKARTPQRPGPLHDGTLRLTVEPRTRLA